MPNFLRLLSQKVHNVNTQSPVLPSDQSGIISPFHHTKKSQIRTILSPDPPLPSLLSARKWELLEGERPGFFFLEGRQKGGRVMFVVALATSPSPLPDPFLSWGFFPPPQPPSLRFSNLLLLLLLPFPSFFLPHSVGRKKGEEFAQGRKKLNKEKAFFDKEGKRRKLNFLSRARANLPCVYLRGKKEERKCISP